MKKYPVGPGKKGPLSKIPGEKSQEKDLVLTPGGPRPRQLVKVVPPGQVVRGAAGGRLRVVPSADPSPPKKKKKHE